MTRTGAASITHGYILISHPGNVLIVWRWLADTDLPQAQGAESPQHLRPCDTSVKVQTHTRYPSFGRILARHVQNLRKVTRGTWSTAARKCGEVGRLPPDAELRSAENLAGRRRSAILMAPFNADALGASAFVTHRDIGISVSDSELYKP